MHQSQKSRNVNQINVKFVFIRKKENTIFNRHIEYYYISVMFKCDFIQSYYL